MKVGRGVVALFMVGSLCAADAPSSPKSSYEMLKALFRGIEHPPASSITRYCFLDLETLLEDSPELEEQFKDLSDEEKEALIDTIDQVNEAIAEVLFSLGTEEGTSWQVE